MVRTGGIAVISLASAMLAGCGAPGPLMPEQRASPDAESRTAPAPETYRVRRGDTLYSIAFGYGLDWRRVASWNDIAAPYTIHVGDWIRLQPPPDMRPAVVAVETPETTPRRAAGSDSGPTTAAERPIRTTGPEPAETPVSTSPTARTPRPSALAETRSPAPASTSSQNTPPVPEAATRSAAGVAWRWPAEGPIARGFNAGASRKGILISGEGGQPIRAAADGEVVYSGNGLIGYGELIIIKHSDRMLSAYAHNRERLVGEGQQVRSGQLIARMGANERDQPVLHFEIRRDGKPDDPANYLPPR